jgi:hypothetical protein
MCPICIAVAGLFAAVFRPWIHLRRPARPAARWRLEDTRDD